MPVIRNEQMDQLGKNEQKKFEDKMVVHLKEFFPDECREVGDDEVRQSIRYGVERAETYGITDERDVCSYIDVMYAFGPDFDKDPACSWAARILNDPDIEDGSQRADELHEEAIRQAAALEGRAGAQEG